MVIVAAALLLPLVRFSQPLWSDEAASLWLARLPLRTLLFSLCDPHPAGYYLALRLWLAAGEAESWLRLPSLLAGIAAALLVYWLGRDLGARAWGWLAALLLVVHPLQVWYAGEVRMYMLAQVLGLLSVWLGWRWLRRAGQKQPLLGISLATCLATVLAFGADYAVIFPFALSQALWLARGRLRPWLWLCLQVVILVGAAALWLRPSQVFALGHSYPATFLAIVLHPLGLGLTPASLGPAMRLGLLLVLAGLVVIGWQWPRVNSLLDQPLFRWLIIGGWLILLMFAAYPRLYSLKRQIVILLPYLALLTAWALWQSPPWLKASLIALSLVITVLLLPQHRRESWDTLVTALQVQAQDGSAVWVDELVWAGFDYYARRHHAMDLRQRASPFPGNESNVLEDSHPNSDATIWLVLYADAYRDLRNLLSPSFHANYELAEAQEFDGFGVYRYKLRSQPTQPPKLPALNEAELWGLHLLSPLSICK